MIDINELTLGQINEICNMQNRPHVDAPSIAESETPRLSNQELADSHWILGKNYFLRTVTHINIGHLIKVTATELVLKNASWVADTGRFQQAIADGTLSEVEPYPDDLQVIVNRTALIDACIWLHSLPRTQK